MSWIRKLFGGQKAESAPPAPTPRETYEGHFLEEVATITRALPGIERVAADRDDFCLNVWPTGASEPLVMNLAGLYGETRELDPEAKRVSILHFVNALQSSTETPPWHEANRQLLPVIRAEAMVAGAPSFEIIRVPFVPCLALHVVLDFADRMQYVTRGALQGWDVDLPRVLAQSLENLAAGEQVVEPYDRERNVWHLAGNDSYESSRLLLPQLRAALADRLGRLAFAIPERGSLYFAPVDDLVALTRLQEIAVAEFGAAPRPLSPVVYVEEGEQMVPLELPAEHALSSALLLARVRFFAGEYEGQAALLKKRFERDGTDLYVSSISALRSEDTGRAFTYCVWLQTVKALLAPTDHVIVGLGEPKTPSFSSLRVTWQDLLALGGEALQVTDEYGLPRWRTLRPLSAQELDALGARRIA